MFYIGEKEGIQKGTILTFADTCKFQMNKISIVMNSGNLGLL